MSLTICYGWNRRIRDPDTAVYPSAAALEYFDDP
jgi:hypothetical protein